jgi:multidrug efflux pump subunit AcrA (membrane-fusion protein)
MHHFLTLAACATAILLSGPLSSEPAPADASAAAQAKTFTVASGSVGGVVRLGGSVEPQQIVNLTAQMPGEVNFVSGSEGDAFRQGDALVALDTQALLAKRAQAESQLATADAAYRNALVQYNQELVNPNSQGNAMLGGAPSLFGMFSDPARSIMGQGDPDLERGSTLYARRIQIETAANAVNQANAALQEIDEALQNAVSYAPFDGVIVKKMVEQGDVVQPGMPLVTFADIGRLQVRVEVPTRLLGILKAGSRVQAQLDGAPGAVPVRVDRIFPMADAGGHTTTVEFALPPGIEAHSGMYAEVILPDPHRRHSALPLIPESAIVWRGSLPAVFRVEEDGSLRLRLIRVDEQAADGMVSVISGIAAGDTILAEPAPNTRGTR